MSLPTPLPGTTPIGTSETGATPPTLPGVTRAPGPLPVIPGPDFAIPSTPAVTEGDPAQFVGSSGTKQQIMEAEMHAEQEAEQTQAAVNRQATLGKLLQSALFTSKRGEFQVLADFHSVAHATTPLDRLVHAILTEIYNDAVTRLENMPAPQ